MCELVKVTLNVRVVVIGASEVGIALLETLAFWFVNCNYSLMFIFYTVGLAVTCQLLVFMYSVKAVVFYFV